MSSKNNFCRYGMLIKRGNGTFSSYSHLSRLNIHLYTRFFLWLRLITRGYHVKLHRSRTLLHAQNTVFAIHAGHFAQSTKIGAGSKQRLLVRCMWINGLMCHERARLREITLFYFLQNIEFQCRVSPPKPFLEYRRKVHVVHDEPWVVHWNLKKESELSHLVYNMYHGLPKIDNN